MDVCRPGGGVPGLAIARRHDVDMAIENQGPLPFDAEQPGDQDRLRALDLHSGKTRMPFQQGNIGLEAIHLEDWKSTRLNSSHSQISYAVFCLKKKNRLD